MPSLMEIQVIYNNMETTGYTRELEDQIELRLKTSQRKETLGQM